MNTNQSNQHSLRSLLKQTSLYNGLSLMLLLTGTILFLIGYSTNNWTIGENGNQTLKSGVWKVCLFYMTLEVM